MAAHDAEQYVGAALASLERQTVNDLEVLVVDDGSADGTSGEVLRAMRRDGRIRLLRMDRNRGQPAALNAGMREARGRYLAVLDADDEATPDRLARQLAAFDRDPDLILVGGAVSTYCDRFQQEGPTWRYAPDDASIRARTLFKSEFISGAMTFDRERLAEHRLRFDERLRVGADWAMSALAMRVGRVANLPAAVMRYRIHPGQLTAGMTDDLASDGARIRARLLRWLGLRPTEEEMRIHLAVSPCNYWVLGSHPYFRARRGSILEDALRWFERLTRASIRSGRVPPDALRLLLEEIAAAIADCLRRPRRRRGEEVARCPVSHPLACIGNDPCRAPRDARTEV